jgi:ankyrin repeat protein
MQEKMLPNKRDSSPARPSLSGKKDAVESAPNDAAKKRLNQEFLVAMRCGRTEDVNECLKKGASVNAKDDVGRTALMLAAKRGSWGVCGLLVENGADVSAKDKNGVDAAAKARSNLYMDLGTYLILILLTGSNEKRLEFTSYLKGCTSQ